MFRVLVLLLLLSLKLSAQPAVVWKFKTGGRIYSSPAADDQAIYIGSNDGNLYCIGKTTGKSLWQFRTGGAVSSPPLVLRNTIISNSSDGYVYCLEKKTGKLRWKFKTGGEHAYDMWDYYLSSPVGDEETVFVGSGDHHIYALATTDGLLQWKFKTGNVVHATPVISNGFLYVGSYDGYFYCLHANDGKLQWKFKTVGDKYFPDGAIQKGAVLKDTVLYFGSRDYNLYAVNARTGKGEWNMKERGSWVIATPLLDNGNLYVGTSDTHRFFALKSDYGEPVWSLPLNMRVYGSAVVHQNIIYVGCFNGLMYGINKETGALEWQFQTDGSAKNYNTVYDVHENFKEGFQIYGADGAKSENMILSLGSILSTPLVSSNTLYFGSADGNVYAVKI